MLTVSVRRQLSGSKNSGQSFWNLLRETQRTILPNTAGCLSAREAIKTACMARELFQTDLIKLEVIGDEINLQPDPFGLVEAATELVKLGFKVFPYCTEDWVLCRRLMDAGCEVLMPWAAPIGTGQGPRNPRALRELRERAPQIPMIIDAGIGPSVSRLPGDGVGFRRCVVEYCRFACADPVQWRVPLPARSGLGVALFWRTNGRPRVAASSTPEIGRPFATDFSSQLPPAA